MREAGSREEDDRSSSSGLREGGVSTRKEVWTLAPGFLEEGRHIVGNHKSRMRR
jgi:hypothetical protein